SYVKYPTGFFATDKGFSAASIGATAAGPSCSAPVFFGVSGTANNVITAGHLVYDAQVNVTGSAPTNMKFNVTLVLGSSPIGTLCIQTPVLILTTYTIDCKFDIGGSTLPASPYTFELTIQ